MSFISQLFGVFFLLLIFPCVVLKYLLDIKASYSKFTISTALYRELT